MEQNTAELDMQPQQQNRAKNAVFRRNEATNHAFLQEPDHL
jgi:hypothetical protein